MKKKKAISRDNIKKLILRPIDNNKKEQILTHMSTFLSPTNLGNFALISELFPYLCLKDVY